MTVRLLLCLVQNFKVNLGLLGHLKQKPFSGVSVEPVLVSGHIRDALNIY